MVVRGKSVALVVAALVCLAPGLRAQYCANFANDSHSIPQLADQFSFRVEANFDEHGRTLIVHELYDSVNNRGSLFARRNGTASHLIYDYDDNEIFFITGFGSDQTCFVQSFSEAAPLVSNTFGVRNVSGSLQIGTASSYFLLVKSAPPTTLIGDEMVRGIPVTHWQACFERPNLTYIADYYYSTDTWNYAAMFNPGMYDSIPILITIRGNETEDDGGIENFYHVYSIFDYHTGPDSVHDHSFRVPNGLVCRGRIPGSPTPTVPNFFSATFQYSISSDTRSNAVATAREYYHLTHKLYRIDAYYDGSRGGSAGPVTLVHDFNTQVEYIINRHTSSCFSSALGNGSILNFDIVDDDEEDTNRLFSPRDLFFLQEQYSYTYEGVINVRGVPVDSWLSVRDFESFSTGSNLTNGVVELYFTRPEYNVSSVYSGGENVIPWAVKLSGVISYSNGTDIFETNITMEVAVFDFSSNEPPYDAFDVSLCFPDSDVHTLIIVFDVPLTGVDFSNLRTNLRSSIIAYTNLQPLQVNNIQLLRSNDTSIILSVHLANLSSFAKVPPGNQLITSDQAFQKINQSTMTNGTLPFKVLINGSLVAPRLLFFGRGRNITLPRNCSNPNNNTMNGTCDNNITNRLKLTDAVVAGIAVGLFFGGLLIGILGTLIACCICKYLCASKESFDIPRKSSSVKYKKHDDELDSIS